MPAHRAYQLYAHITWHTWKRAGCLDQAAVRDVKSAAASASRKTTVRVLRGAVLADHLHLLVSFRPDTRLSDFVRLVKSVAALRANRRVPGAVRWARGFYAASVHRRDLPRVVSYIARQHAPLRSSASSDEAWRLYLEHRGPRGLLTPGASPGITEVALPPRPSSRSIV